MISQCKFMGLRCTPITYGITFHGLSCEGSSVLKITCHDGILESVN